ncbi:hypothetical protein F5148DRAFT_1285230 [Russula earlei]|uniref:Uncharacterized protein n=1 Tax=Russula earlei TaxID=71964 RepID=A0ACC0U6S4_9AGAM|nr:hypothetical protein F5148DRAFT_1285230 [Russula earlei]
MSASFFFTAFGAVSLTPILSRIPSAVHDDDRQNLYAAFYGALDLSRRIDDEAELFINARDLASSDFELLSSIPTGRTTVPPPVHCQKAKEIFVRFSQRYSIELHEFRAPKILGFERPPGGWFATANGIHFPI